MCATSQARAALVTGCVTGQLCLWSVDTAAQSSATSNGERLCLTPRVVLLGHTAPVVWTACCLFDRSDALVSLCAHGLLNVWDPMDGRCLSSAAAPVLPVASVGIVLPQLTHAVVGGECQSLVVVQLSTMAVRAVLAPLDDWCIALAATSGSDMRTRLVSLDGAGVLRVWALSVSSSGAVDAASSAPRTCRLPPLPLPVSEEESARRIARKAKALAEADSAAAAAATIEESPWALRRAARLKAAAASKRSMRQAYDDEPVYRPIWERDEGEVDAEEEEEEEAPAAPAQPPLPLVGSRHVSLSVDATWLLLLSADGAVCVYDLDRRVRSSRPASPSHRAAAAAAAPALNLASPASTADGGAPSMAAATPLAASSPSPAAAADGLRPVCLRLLLQPATSRCAHGWTGARFVRHSGAWAVLAWSSAVPPTIFVLPSPDLEVAADEAEDVATALGAEAVASAVATASSSGRPPIDAQFTCASAVAAAWLPSLLSSLPSRPSRSPTPRLDAASPDAEALAAADSDGPPVPNPNRGGVVFIADRTGTLHLMVEHKRGLGGPLSWVSHAPLAAGWPTPPSEEGAEAGAAGADRLAPATTAGYQLLPAESEATASCVVTQEGVPYVMVLGHADGSLSQVPLPGGPVLGLGGAPPFGESGYGQTSRRSALRHRHSSRVTDLLPLRNGTSDRLSAERGCFASASASGEVRVWSVGGGPRGGMGLLHAFHQHTSAIHCLLQPPSGVPLHMESWFLAVGADGAISVYDASPLLPQPALGASQGSAPDGPVGSGVGLIALLSGHAQPVRELVWRPAECMLCVRCSMRQHGAPRADGSVPGLTPAYPGVTSATFAVGGGAAGSAGGAVGTAGAGAGTSANGGGGAGGVGVDWESTVYVWQLPAGRIARVLSGAEARPHLQSMRASPLCQPVPDATGLREYRIQSHHASASKRLVENVRVSLGPAHVPLQVLIFNIKRLAVEAQRGARARESEFQGQPSPRFRRPGFRQADMAMADMARGDAAAQADAQAGAPLQGEEEGGGGGGRPLGDGQSAADSGSSSAGSSGSRLLAFGDVPPDVAACQSALSFMCCWGVDEAFDAQCRSEIGLHPPAPPITYGVRGHGGNFSFLTPRAQARHHRWQCSSHLTALHSIAAVALANTLMMSPGYDEVRNVCSSLVTHFSVALPERLPHFCSPSLSLLARHYVDSVEEVQQAARALMEGTIHRMQPEVRSQIMAAWSPRIVRLAKSPNAASTDLASPQGVCILVLAVLASRFATAIDPAVCALLVHQLLALLDHPADLHRAAGAELLGKGYSVWRAHIPDAPALIRTLFKLSAAHMRHASSDGNGNGSGNGSGNGEGGAAGGNGSEQPAALPSLNRYHAALLAVGTAEPRHFCRAMGEHAVHMGGSNAARIAAVSAMISLVKARGTSLEADLPVVVHAVLRPLDPSVPMLREGCLHASTTAIRELVKRYPMMAFHQGTQRLAVGTTEGVVIIYDLKTATKWRILTGHEKAVSALAFSKAGEHVASLAAEERSIRWWLAGSQGIFGFLGLQGSCLHTSTIEQPLAPADAGVAYELEWTSPTGVRLSCNKRQLGTYERPV